MIPSFPSVRKVAVSLLLWQTALSIQGAEQHLKLRQGEDGYAGVQDVSLDYQLQPSERLGNNFGRAPVLSLYSSGGKQLALSTGETLRNEDGWSKVILMRFDLSGVPRGAKVREVKLVLKVASSPERSVAQKYELRRLQRNGIVFGSSLDEPEPGSVSAMWSRSPDQGWGTSDKELMPREGRDFEPSAFASSALEPGQTELSFVDIEPFIVQDWIDHPESETGFVIYPTTPSRAGGVQVQFASSEHQNESARPTLEIIYE